MKQPKKLIMNDAVLHKGSYYFMVQIIQRTNRKVPGFPKAKSWDILKKVTIIVPEAKARIDNCAGIIAAALTKLDTYLND